MSSILKTRQKEVIDDNYYKSYFILFSLFSYILNFTLTFFLSGNVWTAPEILRNPNPPPSGTQKGDVYSFGIISYEILTRKEPFDFDTVSPKGKENISNH